MTAETRRLDLGRAIILMRLAERPAGDPTLIGHWALGREVGAGHVRLDTDGVPHLTPLGWYAMGAKRQDRLWGLAVVENALRQGPVDAELLRRLVLEYACAEQAYRRLAAAGQPSAAKQVWDEGVLIKARLAVILHIPLARMDEESVMLGAMDLADDLDARTLADDGNVAGVDPRERLERAGITPPGNYHHNPWLVTATQAADAFLSS